MKVISNILIVLGAMSALVLSGCLEDSDLECANEMPVFCDGEEDESDRACEADEEGCRSVSLNVCGNETVRYCREAAYCPEIGYQCREGTVPCNPMEDGPSCEAQVFGSGVCAETLYCTPAAQCQAELSCALEEELSGDPCQDNEIECREITVCGDTGYCRPAEQCLALPVCPEGYEETRDVCDDDSPDCLTETLCGTTIHCWIAPQCDAFPVCDEGMVESDEPCTDEDVFCRERTACGQTIYCRENVNCDAAPVCDEDEMGSQRACGANERTCREVRRCGDSLFCRPGAMCLAVPTCAREENESFEPCGRDEIGCREETECGQTIFCREDIDCDAAPFCEEGEVQSPDACRPDEEECRAVRVCGDITYCRPVMGRQVDQQTQAAVCEPIEWPMDAYEVRQAELEGDWLYLDVEYSGGCAQHVFNSCWEGSFLESNPVQAMVTLSHDANGDLCEAIESQTVGIDLSLIRAQYQRLYRAENGEVIIRLDAPGVRSFRYIF